jgi:hypothetical protein
VRCNKASTAKSDKMVIAHTGIKVTKDDITKVAEWYTKALAPLGYKKTRSFYNGLATGFSDHEDGNDADWWVSGVLDGQTALSVAVPNSHHAFIAKGSSFFWTSMERKP